VSRKLSMTQRVVDQLREDIINWKYEENNIITETEIAKAFDVSKTPAREALTTLCMEGFLEKLPNKGYLVKGISVSELQNLFQFRRILEVAAIEIAIQYATDKDIDILEELSRQSINEEKEITYNEMNYNFHIYIAYISKNTYLISALKSVLTQLRRVLVMDWRHIDDEHQLDHHVEIFQAIKARDIETAIGHITEEIDTTIRRIYFEETRNPQTINS